MPTKRGKRWRATVWDPRSEQQRGIGTFDTKREAREAEADYRKATTGTSSETCDHFAERWVKDYPRPRETTNRHNTERVQRFARDFRSIRLYAVSKPEARSWAMANRHCLSAVRAMFGDAVRDGIVPANPFADLRLPGSGGRKHVQPLSEAELVDLAQKVHSLGLGDFAPEYEAMILFAGYVGLRPGELFALKRIDVNGSTVNIERALSKSGIGPTKTGRSRTVIIPPPVPLGQVSIKDSGLLFESPAGKMWRQSSHHHYWDRLRTLADKPGLDFYTLRHTAATMLMERGAAPWEVAQQLGHTDGGQLVANLYGHPRDEVARARMAAMWQTSPIPVRAVESA